MTVGVATAGANIALVKYWGKRDTIRNLPAAGSLSLTLDALRTWTEVSLTHSERDELIINGEEQKGRAFTRASKFLDLVRERAGMAHRVRIRSKSSFPVAGGLASSASGFAALAAAASRAFGISEETTALAELARRGSGSAARSCLGGFVEMVRDGTVASLGSTKLELSALVLVVRASEKEVSSTYGMEETRKTSPYFEPWVLQAERDRLALRAALIAGDFEGVAAIAEANCLAMHASAMAARPGIVYFLPETVELIHWTRAARKAGQPVFFSVDAGPNVVLFTPPEALAALAQQFEGHRAVSQIIPSQSGPAVQFLAEYPGGWV